MELSLQRFIYQQRNFVMHTGRMKIWNMIQWFLKVEVSIASVYQRSPYDSYDSVVNTFLTSSFDDITFAEVLEGILPAGYGDQQDDISATLTKKDQFDRAVKCCRQMFNEKLIKWSEDLPEDQMNNFDTLVSMFLNQLDNGLSYEDVLNGKIPADYKSEYDHVTNTPDMLMEEAITVFVYDSFLKTDEYETRINDLKLKVENQEFKIVPMREFIKRYRNKYAPIYYVSSMSFCDEYRRNENLDSDSV